MRILHVANFNLFKNAAVYYAVDRKLSHGLIRNGHFVYDFSYRDIARSTNLLRSKHLGQTAMNRNLLETSVNLAPDLLLLGHSELVTADTLREIRKLCPGIKIALWYVDWIIPALDMRHVLDRIDCLDTLFFTTGGELLRRFERAHNTVRYIPNPVDESVETLRNDEQREFEIDLLFCGTDKDDPQRTAFLRHLRDRLADLRITYRGALGEPTVFGNRYLQMLHHSKMGLNLSRRSDVHCYSSDRIAQLTGNGLLTFTPETPGMRLLYRDDEVVYFRTIDDLADKSRYYHQHDAERRRIAAAGRARAHQAFNSTRVARYIVETTFGMSSGETYEWTE